MNNMIFKAVCIGLLLTGASTHAKLILKLAGLYAAYNIGQSAGVYCLYAEYDEDKLKFIKHKQQRQSLAKRINETDLTNLSAQDLHTLLSTDTELFSVIERIIQKMKRSIADKYIKEQMIKSLNNDPKQK